ncbi:hypothetical protein D3C73_1658180 [compost metagenome]
MIGKQETDLSTFIRSMQQEVKLILERHSEAQNMDVKSFCFYKLVGYYSCI